MSNLNDFVIENGVLAKYVGEDRDVVIPDGVASIGVGAFRDCYNLKNITIPDGVTSISAETFYGCSGLTNIEIPQSVTDIGDYAFFCCSNLLNITLSDNITNIGTYAFNTCRKLFLRFNGEATVGERAFDEINCIVAPNLSFSCFDTSAAKKAAVVEGYLKNFQDYKNEKILEEYQKYMISQRKKILPHILKDDLVEMIAFYAEKKKITVTTFEEEYLSPAMQLNAKKCILFLLDWKDKNISIDEIDKKINRELSKDPFNVADMKKIWSYEKGSDGIILTGYKGKEVTVEIPLRIGKDPVVALGDNVFSPKAKTGNSKPASYSNILKAITTILIPEGIKSIGNSAFEHCKKLEHIEIPKSVIDIGWRTFSDCHSLKHIEIPAGVTELKTKLFQRCKNLETVVLPEGLLKIGNNVFYECEMLQSINLPDSLTKMGMQVFLHCTSLSCVKLSPSLKSICFGTFTECKGLERIEIPKSVARIADCAFQYCTRLNFIKLSDQTKTIEEQAFKGCQNLIIHAPAGSYAETYAKENNIPFVAE